MANLAVKEGNGYKLDKAHVLVASKFDDIPKFAEMDDTYVDPEIDPFTEREHLRSWLADPRARDQWVMLKGEDVGVYWNNKSEAPDKAKLRTVTQTYSGLV
jgi:translation initiation factor 3 subunit B